MLIDNDGARHVRYDRTYRGLPVVGGDLMVHRAANGKITSTTWAHEGALKVAGVTPKLSTQDASKAAERSAKHVKQARTSNLDSSQLVVWAVGKVPVLAYRSTVTGAGAAGANTREAVLVDAASGAVLDQ
ncbi:hypothetical protein [Kitasatospora sp. NPDC048407]|uniref:hypothetical protein n=1 Tax=Kitasatospora sp. NPDC048407 TaxID=3364051 RepID=UPI00371A18EE